VSGQTPVHQAIARVGWLLVVIGLAGLIVLPRLLLLWVFFIGFGVAALPRATLEWWRSRHGR
jgi:hypothetical protein